MGWDLNGTSQYLSRATVPLTAAPLTLACWFNPDTITRAEFLLSLADSASNNNAFGLRLRGDTSDTVQFQSQSASASGTAVSTGTFSAGAWQHACGVEAASNDRRVYLNGANKGTDATAVTPSSIDRMMAGAFAGLTLGGYLDGKLAEVAVWNEALSDGEVAILALGYSPLLIRTWALVAYYPLLARYATEPDLVGGAGFTLNGSPTIYPHPRILLPDLPIFEQAPQGPSVQALRAALYSRAKTANKRTRLRPPQRRRYLFPRSVLLPALLVQKAALAQPLYRIEQTAAEVYELYAGTGGDEPDLDGTPIATSATLPFDTSALSYPETYKFVVLKRNRYGLKSRNVASFTLELDGAGAVVATPPSAPEYESLSVAAAGAFRIQAQYPYEADGANAADTFLVYLTVTGTDPDPSMDTPVEVPMVKRDGVAHLDYTSATNAHGTTGKLIVRTRRQGSPDVDSTNVNVIGPVLADAQGPAAPAGGAFFGSVAEQGQ